VIVAPSAVLDAIREHGRKTYPEECCGALLGVRGGGRAAVRRIERLANGRVGERHRRFRIDAADYRRVEAAAEESGLVLLGFYHSHPDHPAVPSDYDREHAMPFFHYVVLAVRSGEPGAIASWVLAEDRGAFERETLIDSEES
jgi:proteasome lid subunit RPN8/RPN11